jgi:hypothetical protein
MGTHSICAPSGAHRWLKCPGSVIYDLMVPGNESSEYAREGTLAHALAAECLNNGRRAKNVNAITVDYYDGVGPIKCDIPPDMGEPVQVYIDNCKKYSDYDLTVNEMSIDLNPVYGGPIAGEDQQGTVDFIAFNAETRHLVCRDLKYGMGTIVSAVENPQVKIYAAAAISMVEKVFGVDVDKVTIEIDQPRINIIPSTWETTRADIGAWTSSPDFTNTLSDIRYIAENYAKEEFRIPERWFNPSDEGCHYCKGKTPESLCPYLVKFVEGEIGAGFEDLDAMTKVKDLIPVMSDERLGRSLKAAALLSDIVALLWAAARLRMEKGIEIPGWKMVEGRKSGRKWTDEKAAEALLRKFKFHTLEMFNTALKSPTQIAKICDQKKAANRWTKLNELVTQEDGKPSIVDENDPKPAIVFGAEDVGFEVLDEEAAVSPVSDDLING